MNRSTTVLVFTIVALFFCCRIESPNSESISGTASRQEAIVDGTVEPSYEAVGALGFEAGWGFSHFCTGTLIAPRWVLTAAHCLEQGGWVLDPRDIGFFIGTYSEDPSSGLVIDCEALHVHESYVPGDEGDGEPPQNDIGLVELSTEAPVTPIAYNTELLVDAEGETVTWVGFGVSDPPYGGSGTKRLGEGQLTAVLFWYLLYGFDGHIPCSGDSGGPALMTLGADHVERVVGVISTADEGCSEGGTSTRVDGYAPWIEATMAGTTVVHECDLLGGDCGPERACLPVVYSGQGACWASEGGGRGDRCEPSWDSWGRAPCADGLICAPSGASGECAAMCFVESDCEGSDECHVPLYSDFEDLGTCQPCRDIDRDGVCRDEDCDDTDERAYPGGVEICNDLVDNDCDGDRDEDDSECGCRDRDGDGHCAAVDCDDTNADVNRDAGEVCLDLVDNDCDGLIDELDPECAEEREVDAGSESEPDGTPDAASPDATSEIEPDTGFDGGLDEILREERGCGCVSPGDRARRSRAGELLGVLWPGLIRQGMEKR